VQENNCYTVSWSCNCDIFASLPTCGLSTWSFLFVFVFTHPSSWLVVASVGVGKEGGRRGVVDEALSSYHCASSRLARIRCLRIGGKAAYNRVVSRCNCCGSINLPSTPHHCAHRRSSGDDIIKQRHVFKKQHPLA
jgi:hypothetical protein